MSISVLDLFKIGVGPSSSHTVGPMRAAHDFVVELQQRTALGAVRRIEVKLYGSLSATGVGHGTDRAVIAGLMGARPDEVDPDFLVEAVDAVRIDGELPLPGGVVVPFDWARDMRLLPVSLPYHPNAMRLIAHGDAAVVYENTYYSVGGGFVIDEAQAQSGGATETAVELPYPFEDGAQLLEQCRRHGLRISELMLANEGAWRSEAETRAALQRIWTVMRACVDRGVGHEGVLPGGLNVRRRAPTLYRKLSEHSAGRNMISDSMNALDWVNLYALAVNEENAGGGRVVTAPTNGAAGIIPAVLHYYMKFMPGSSERDVENFLLAAAAVGVLCKKNASISGAEVGCQGEVGSACAMAAAGLAEVLGGTPEQVENAAEIGLEHNLGLTCDPVGGLVQVPCIERNAMASVKAINAAQLALRGDGSHFMPLDNCIEAMRQTGEAMNARFKETSLGGLAVNLPEC